MATSIEIPELGESVTEGTVTIWLKKVGDTVEVNEPLLGIFTDKVDTEISSPVAGVLTEILFEEDDTVDVGEVIAKVGKPDKEPEGADDSIEETEEEAPKEKAEEPKREAPGAASDSATDIEIPELGGSVTEGVITTWLKEVGGIAEVDGSLLEVSTDKVNTEIPSPVAGALLEVFYDEDDTVNVGEVIAHVGGADAAPTTEGSAEEEAEEASAAVEKGEEPVKANKETEGDFTVVDAGDATSVEMPELGESVTRGIITTWLKKVGDTVEVDKLLLEISADKVDTEIPSPVAGTLLEVLYDEDDTVGVGEAIARVDNGQSEKDAPKRDAPEGEEPEKEAPKAETPKAESKPSASKDVPYVTPLVCKLADKHGIDLIKIEDSGIGDRTRKQGVLRATEGGQETAAESNSNQSTKDIRPELTELRGTTQRVNRIRRITTTKTPEPLQISAQLTQIHEIDMTAIWDPRTTKRAGFERRHDVELTFLPFLAEAIVEALVSHPNVNTSWNEETKEITYHKQVNLGVAVGTGHGLLSPVTHSAQDMSLPELAAAIADIAGRARNNKLTPSNLSGGTFTITNIGSEDTLTDTPILVPPRTAMIGTGVIRKRAVVVIENEVDTIGIRAMVSLPVTHDHRLIDGVDVGRFMTTIVDCLEVANFESDLQL